MLGRPPIRPLPPEPKRGSAQVRTHQLDDLARLQAELHSNCIKSRTVFPRHLDYPIRLGSRKFLVHILLSIHSGINRNRRILATGHWGVLANFVNDSSASGQWRRRQPDGTLFPTFASIFLMKWDKPEFRSQAGKGFWRIPLQLTAGQTLIFMNCSVVKRSLHFRSIPRQKTCLESNGDGYGFRCFDSLFYYNRSDKSFGADWH